MIYIIWGLLNLFFFAGFLVVAYYAAKQIRARYGLFVAWFFVFATCSFMNHPSKDNSMAPMRKLTFKEGKSSLQFQDEKGVWYIPDSLARQYQLLGSKKIEVYKTSLFTIHLTIHYATESPMQKKIPVYAHSSFTGTLIGLEWQPIYPVLNIDQTGNKLEYELKGVMKWGLMNMDVYSETKQFQGTIDLEK